MSLLWLPLALVPSMQVRDTRKSKALFSRVWWKAREALLPRRGHLPFPGRRPSQLSQAGPVYHEGRRNDHWVPSCPIHLQPDLTPNETPDTWTITGMSRQVATLLLTITELICQGVPLHVHLAVPQAQLTQSGHGASRKEVIQILPSLQDLGSTCRQRCH